MKNKSYTIVDKKTIKKMFKADKKAIKKALLTFKKNEKSIGNKIRKLRLEKNLGLREFAKKIGESATYITQLENNSLEKFPNKEIIEKISKVLNIELDELTKL